MVSLQKASTRRVQKEDAHLLSKMKQWLHSLNTEQLLDAMKFPFKSYPDTSSSHEYDLLLEMLSNQSPPPTPIHPKAMGFTKQASTQPITDGRWDEDERILRNRFVRPRLFQFLERSSPSFMSGNDDNVDDILNGLDISSLGLPAEIAELVHAEKKTSNFKGTNSQKIDKVKHRYFDVLPKKCIQPWGDIYSLGCTERQRVADANIMIGTRIHYGCSARTTSTTNQNYKDCGHWAEFEPNINLRLGTLSCKAQYESAVDILTMLRIVSRGKFLSMALNQKRYDNLGRQLSFCAPWFDPTKEWFSLPMYLASRFEIALWSSFHDAMTNADGSMPQTIIEKHFGLMDYKSFHRCVLTSIHKTLANGFLEYLSMVDSNFYDLTFFQLLRSEATTHYNIDIVDVNTLLSVKLLCIGKPIDKFRLQLVQQMGKVLSEEASKSLLESYPKECEPAHKGKVTKRTTRKKKNRRKQKRHTASGLLKSIDEDKDEGAKIKEVEGSDPLENQLNYFHHDPNKTLNNNKIFILEIVDDILVETFQRIGFNSYDGDEMEDFSTKVKCHETHELPPQRGDKTYVLRKNNKRNVTKSQDRVETDINVSHVSIDDNQMTMKRSNLTWDKTIKQPAFRTQDIVNDFFRPHTLHEAQFSSSLLDNQRPNPSQNILQFQQHDYIEDLNYSTQNNYCLDSAFDRIEKNIINELLDSEQRFESEYFASSTAASIASSILEDLENDQVSNGSLSDKNSDKDDDKFIIRSSTSDEGKTIPVQAVDDKIKELIGQESRRSSTTSSILLENKSSQIEEDDQDMKKESIDRSLESPITEEPNTPPPQLSPIMVTLAELGEFRKRSQKGSSECGYSNLAQAPFSSMPSSPKFPTRSWSREDLRIPLIKDDSHDFRGEPSLKSYKNAALKGFRKTPSVSSHDVRIVETNTTRTRKSESIKFARSVSSLKSFGKEVIIDASFQLNMCAQSESALDDHEDSSHWNVIPNLGLDETDNATLTKDGATTISSFPSIQETEEFTYLREERNAYRDMCLTLGSEIAKLKNLLAAEHSNSSFMQIPSHSTSFEFVPSAQSSCDPEHIPPFYHNRFKGLSDNLKARSDAGIHNDAIMSEDGTEIMYDSVVATDASCKHRTVNSSNIRLSSMSEGRAESDLASVEFDAGKSVFNPPTSTCFFRRESFGPAHLHGLQSRLGREISNFLSNVSSQLEKRCNTREVARKRLTTLVTTLWPRAQVKIYGSHVTDLCLPSSDLDFVICLPAVHKNTPANTPGDLEGRNAINETNQKLLARKLKSESWIDPRSIKIIERTIVPVIKVATKDIRSKSLQLDISFDSQDHHGLDAIEMVNDMKSHYPMIRPLVLVLKQFLLDKGLLTAYTGGLSSYCVFLMVTKYLQEHPLGWNDSGVYLMGFLDFYGNHFDPRSTGISVRKKQYFARPYYPRRHDISSTNNFKSTNIRGGETPMETFVAEDGTQAEQRHRRVSIMNPTRPFSFDPLFVEDPISHGNNVGRNSFRINQVQRAFSDAHRTLVASLEWDMNSADEFGQSHLLKCLIQGDSYNSELEK